MASAHNNETTRLSLTELRRRLQPPTAAAPAEPAPAPVPETGPPRRSAGATGGSNQLSEIEAAAARFAGAPLANGAPALNGRHHVEVEEASAFDGPATAIGCADDEVGQLRAENEELRTMMLEVRELLEEATASEQAWQEKERQYQAQLDEMSEHLRAIEEQLNAAPPPPKNEDELSVWADELEREAARQQQERRRLDEDMRQLREDEEALEKQMRDQEVQMARERALMARQETELKRLSAEIGQELERMQGGDAILREQMTKFSRRHQEVLARSAGLSAPPPEPAAPPPLPPQPPKRDSGLFKRFFRPKG